MITFWYAFWIIVVFLIICGLMYQLEVEKKDEERRHRRLIIRDRTWDEVEQVIYRSHDPTWTL